MILELNPDFRQLGGAQAPRIAMWGVDFAKTGDLLRVAVRVAAAFR